MIIFFKKDIGNSNKIRIHKDKDRDALTSFYMTCWILLMDLEAAEAEEEIRLDVILLRPLADGSYVRRGTMVFAGDALKEVRHQGRWK